jgi:cardiolipin synthase
MAEKVTIISSLVLMVHVLGIINAAHAVMNVRLSQSAIAWSISLITFPWLAIPLYWILGRRKFYGYSEAYRQAYEQYRVRTEQSYQKILPFAVSPPKALMALDKLANSLTEIPFTSANGVQLLINGEQTYRAMLAAIETAQNYILFQFYIINDDETGRKFQQALIEKAQQGVRIYFLYDQIGSWKLSRNYLRKLQKQGIRVTSFKSNKGIRNRFQINFRNHRKILIVDGRIAFVGGLNIGSEYLGKNRKYGLWRDTHMSLQGPAVKALQLSFLKDWYWGVREIPQVNWNVDSVYETEEIVFVLPTGPADRLQTCTLFFDSVINLAQTRLWIASPYFVPDEPTLTALKMAALRGVDVRIILPRYPDHLIVYLCSFSYYNEIQEAGIKLYRYKTGFMHQKVILVDDVLAGVGTVNLDNRSFMLNFEVMTFVTKGDFLASVETMLQTDWAESYLVNLSEYSQRPFWFKLAVQTARLLAPLQ